MCKVHKSSQIFVASDKPILINYSVNELEDENHDLSEEDCQFSEKEQEQQSVPDKEVYFEEINKKCRQILEGAHIKANKIINDAKRDADTILKDAKNEGFQKGFEEGKKESEKKYYKTIQEAENVLINAKIERKNIINSIENDIVDLIAETTRKIIIEKIEKDDKIFTNIVGNAISKFKADSQINIKVSPDDYQVLHEQRSNLVKGNNIKHIEIIKDTGLKRGDCILSSESEEIDAGVDTQIDYIRRGLKQIV